MRKTIYLIAILLVLSACSSSDLNTEKTPTPNAVQISVLPEFTPTVDIVLAEEIPKQLSIQEISPTLTPTLEASLFQSPLENCLEIIDAPEKTFPGSLVLHDGLLDLTSYELQPFDARPFREASLVSPNGEMLAVISPDLDALWIKNSRGVTIVNYPVDNLTPIYWLDNEKLVLQSTTIDVYDTGVLSYIFDLETRTMIEFDMVVDQIDTLPHNLGFYWDYAFNTRTSINPQVSYLVFSIQLHELVLWDISRDEEVMRFNTFIGTDLPRWNRVGDRFLVSAEAELVDTRNIGISETGNDLFSVDINGNIERLSHTAEIVHAYQHDYVWSPDEQKIAFLMEYLSYGMWGFQIDALPVAILDLQTGEVEDLCIKADLPPVWSLDGRYLAVSNFYEGVYIIDLLEYKAYLVYQYEYFSIHGWLN